MADNEFTTAFEEAWRPFREAAGALAAAGRLDEPTTSGWTAKELLAHIAFWDEGTPAVITMILRGGGMPDDWTGFGSGYEPGDEWPHADVHNAREAEWARRQSADAVLARLDKAYAYARSWLARLTPDEVRDERFRQFFFSEKTAHYDAHLPELTALLDGAASE